MTGTQFDANAASFVRTLYRTPDVVAQREAVREALGASASQRVLDVGSGPGYLAAELIADGAEVVGIDTSESMHAIAREEAPDARLCVADARMRTAGFQDVSVRTVTMINQRYEPSAFSHGISRSIASFAARNGVPPESTGAWLEELAALDASAEYFFSLDRFLFTARKPDA